MPIYEYECRGCGDVLTFTAPERIAGALRQLRRPARPWRVLDGLIDPTQRCGIVASITAASSH